MSKAKRIIAMLLTVLMALSVLSAMTFAASAGNLFTEAYNDPTGTIKNSAVLVDANVAGMTNGQQHVAYWDGGYYTFIVGENVFATYDEAKTAISINGQVLLGDGKFGEISLDRPMQVFGINWNVNPNAVDESDPTADWTRNSAWDERSSVVTNICIRAGGIKNVGVYGVVMQGRFYDIWRQASSQKTTLTVENVLLKQDASVLATYYTNSKTGRSGTNNAYIFMLWNENSGSSDSSAMYNVDETVIRNLRIEADSIAAPCSRLMDEKVSPKLTFEGLYIDSTVFEVSGASSSIGWWMKFADYSNNASISFNKCCFTGTKTSMFHFEGCNKAAVGSVVENQVLELNFTNNLFYNVPDSYFNIYPEAYSKINISGNYMVKTSAGSANKMISWASANSGTDYSDRVVMRDNTFLGYSGFAFSIGSSDTKIDMTGTYISTSARTDGWRSTSSTVVPTGNVRYDYCWYNAAKTKASNAVSDFSVTNASAVDKTNYTITAEAPAGTEVFVPEVSSSDSEFEYKIYESDASFSNASSYANGNTVENCLLENYTNYFLLVAMSQDGTRGDVYKMTVTKPVNTDVTVNGLIVAQPSDADDYTVTQNGLIYDLALDREFSETEFILDTLHNVTVYNADDNTLVKPSTLARYKISDLEVGKTVALKIYVDAGTTGEYYYLNVSRNFNNECELISVDNLTLNGNQLTADADGSATSYSFTPVLSTGAECYVWQGTSVAVPDENGKITVTGLTTGKNVFSLVVKAENGVDEKVYTLTVNKPMSSENELLGVANTELVDGVYTATVSGSSFKVEPTVSAGATYKLFSDPSCTKLIANNTVTVEGDTCVYIVITSEDGRNVSSPIRIDIKKTKGSITVEGAEQVDNFFVIALDADTETTTLNITAENATYKLYADASLTREASKTVTLDQANTYIFVEINYADGTSEVGLIYIISERTPVEYKDASSIPAWANEYIDTLNNAGLGILKGDQNGNFNAKNNMTRYEIAAVAVRILGVDATQFAGVKLGYTDEIAAWAQNYVKAASALGIMSGSNDANGKLVFNGKDTTTRAQLAKIIVEITMYNLGVDFEEFYELTAEEVESTYNEYAFADEASVQNWAKNYVKTAVALELFNGTEVDGKNYFNPNNAIMRSEIAAVVTRYFGL